MSGGANVIPKIIVKTWNLWCQGEVEEAMKLQEVVSRGDWLMGKPGVPGTKATLQQHFGYRGFARRPSRRVGEDDARGLADKMREVMDIESEL